MTPAEDPDESPELERDARAPFPWGLVLYAVTVDQVDTLASLGRIWELDLTALGVGILEVDWTVFAWLRPSGLDPFKLLVFLVIPLALTWRSLDPGWFDPRRMRPRDLLALGAIASLGVAAMFLIPLFPELRETYPSFAGLDPEKKWVFARAFLAWTLSWLVGWEILYRYLLLSRLDRWDPRHGWLLVPVLEFVGHLSKPWLEAFGMVAFSLVLTPWVRLRRCVIPGLLAHLLVELDLLAFLLAW